MGDRERRVVTATVIGVPVPGTVVWRATDAPDRPGDVPVSGDLDDPERRFRTDDRLVLEVERDRFRWLVVSVVEALPSPTAPPVSKPRRPHAHPARPPGTVLIAWLPFTSEDDEGPGKHRPCVVLHSSDPNVVRVRPLYDPGSAVARRSSGTALQAWRAAGLDKASVAVDPVEVPVARCEQTLGQLSPVDRTRLGIVRTRRAR